MYKKYCSVLSEDKADNMLIQTMFHNKPNIKLDLPLRFLQGIVFCKIVKNKTRHWLSILGVVRFKSYGRMNRRAGRLKQVFQNFF